MINQSLPISQFVFLVIVINFVAHPVYSIDNSSIQRLFSTPAQRQSLDNLRNNIRNTEQASLDKTTPSENTAGDEAAEAPDRITVQGYMHRSNGKRAVWVQNQMVNLDTHSNQKVDLQINEPETNYVLYQLPGTTQTIRLQPGQTYFITSKQTLDSYKKRNSLPIQPNKSKVTNTDAENEK